MEKVKLGDKQNVVLKKLVDENGRKYLMCTDYVKTNIKGKDAYKIYNVQIIENNESKDANAPFYKAIAVDPVLKPEFIKVIKKEDSDFKIENFDLKDNIGLDDEISVLKSGFGLGVDVVEKMVIENEKTSDIHPVANTFDNLNNDFEIPKNITQEPVMPDGFSAASFENEPISEPVVDINPKQEDIKVNEPVANIFDNAVSEMAQQTIETPANNFDFNQSNVFDNPVNESIVNDIPVSTPSEEIPSTSVRDINISATTDFKQLLVDINSQLEAVKLSIENLKNVETTLEKTVEAIKVYEAKASALEKATNIRMEEYDQYKKIA